MDPSDPAVIYATVADGALPGLYRTRNTGKSWEPVKGLGGAEVYSLAIWAKDSQVMAVGMRDGVRLTRDGGATWEPISPAGNIELQPVVSVAFDPRNSDVIYAGTPRLPWKTSDGGANWTLIAEGMSTDSDIITLRVDPTRPSRVFIGACSGFWRSTNAGAVWSKMSGIPFTSRRTYAFAQDPQHPEIIFAGTSRGLYRTVDGGAEWKNIAANEIKGLAIQNGIFTSPRLTAVYSKAQTVEIRFSPSMTGLPAGTLRPSPKRASIFTREPTRKWMPARFSGVRTAGCIGRRLPIRRRLDSAILSPWHAPARALYWPPLRLACIVPQTAAAPGPRR
jgi:photosystem II stability/assembly factor-like uncharacterized protein